MEAACPAQALLTSTIAWLSMRLGLGLAETVEALFNRAMRLAASLAAILVPAFAAGQVPANLTVEGLPPAPEELKQNIGGRCPPYVNGNVA